MKSTEIKKYFEQKTDKDYTGYLDKTKMGRLFKDTIYRVLDEKIANLGGQKSQNQIGDLIKLGRSYTINNNKIIVGKTPIINVTIISATIFEVTTGFDHNMVSGDNAIISDVQGTLNIPTINAVLSATVINSTVFRVTVASATGVVVVNTGSVYTSKQIPDYYAVWTVKPSFLNDRQLTITKASNTSTIRVTFTGNNSIRTKDQVKITGVIGNTNANGTFYVSKINPSNIDLFVDEHLTIPVVGNGTYTSGGTLVTVYSEYAKPIVSDKKISTLGRASLDFPKFEEGDHALKFLPSDYVCPSIVIDYVSTPKEINFYDEDTDYTLYYNEKFLFYLIDRAAENFLAEIRDTEGVQLQQQQNQLNK